MALEGNGNVVDPDTKGVNGKVVVPKSPRPKPKKNTLGSIISIVTRLLTWYSIITVILRCPNSINLLDDSSPKICKPYFQVKARVGPHITPYYDSYGTPYLNAARPYYDVLDKKVVTPLSTYGRKYGAPMLEQVQAFGQTQWEKSLQPQVSKFNAVAQQQYTQNLAPYVNKSITAAIPYYDIARDSALQTYYASILPTYYTLQPYAEHAYGVGNDFAVNIGIPYAKWVWSTSVVFLDRTVWPKLRILYGENVEPQLIRIGERLGRYRDRNKLQAAMDKVDLSSSSSTLRTFSSTSSSIASTHATTPVHSPMSLHSPSLASVPPPADTPLSEHEIRAKAQAVVAEDLRSLQEKFAKAADEGSSELEERITEITDRFIQNQVRGVGEAHLIRLEETISAELKNLKRNMLSIIKKSINIEASEADLIATVRKAGLAIKDKAQAIRTWRRNYDLETNSLVSKAVTETFEIIDHIRDLGLQEIGMRWAWMEGITHKDWSKYHAMKNKFDEWRNDVEEVATTHPGLEKAREASEDVENRAMTIAADIAKELARLKEVGKWKLSAGDSTDDFSTKYIPPAAATAGQKILKEMSDWGKASDGSTQRPAESLISDASTSLAETLSSTSLATESQIKNAEGSASEASKSTSGTVSSISSSVIGTSPGSIESMASIAKDSASSFASEISSSIISTVRNLAESVLPVTQGTTESIVSDNSNSASSLVKKVLPSVVGNKPGVVEQSSSSMQSANPTISEAVINKMGNLSKAESSSPSSLTSVTSSASTITLGSTPSSSTSLSSSVSSASSDTLDGAGSISASVDLSASSTPDTESSKVWGGAMAYFVEAREIVYEDVLRDEGSSFSENMARESGGLFSDITRAVSEALLIPTSTQGSGESVTSLAAEQYSKAFSAASAALHGNKQGTGEKIADVASSRYADAVSAAKTAIYGIPTPKLDYLASQASSKYGEALSTAKDHYSRAISIVSAQISGTPKPVHQEMFASVESAYSDSLHAASSKLESALAAASFAIYGPPPGAFESISSIAASKLSEALSTASAQYASVKSAFGTAPTPAAQRYFAQAQNQYYAGIGLAHARYTEFIEAASSAIMPTPTPFHQDLYNRASCAVIGTPIGSFEGAMSAAQSRYLSAVAAASSSLNELIASEASSADKTNIPSSNLAVLASSRYSVAISAASDSLASASSAASIAIYGETLESLGSKASERAESIVSRISSTVHGSETPRPESAASAASENWKVLVTKASIEIYGAPTPLHESIYSQAMEYAAQATSAASAQYTAVESLISELLSGKEPDFTESIYRRFSSMYYTGAGAAASGVSSLVSEAHGSASSAIISIPTPPPTLEAILDSASSRINEVVDAASIHLYGTQKGPYEQATSSAASAFNPISSLASVQIYGSSTGYVEAASSSIAEAASSAQKAIIDAIYSTSTPPYQSATSIVGDKYSSATSVVAAHISAATSRVGDTYAAAQAKVNSMIYGPEADALESAQSKLGAAVESARIRLSDLSSAAREREAEAVRRASEGAKEFASSVSSTVESATFRLKDEL